MNSISNLLRSLIGKNLASWIRSLITYGGGFLAGYGFMDAVNTADGIQLHEFLTILLGFGMMLISGFINWIRRQRITGYSLSPLAELLGPILGRSWHSVTRRLFTFIAGMLPVIGAANFGDSEVKLANLDLAEIITSALIYFGMRIYSRIQEGRA